jgi:acetoin utilization deacetylase AcuC-like enzyme
LVSRSAIFSIYEKFYRPELTQVASRLATDEELALIHDVAHVEDMKSLPNLSQLERDEVANGLNSIFLNKESLNSALLASGSLLNVVDKVCNEEATRGVAIIRPPGLIFLSVLKC